MPKSIDDASYKAYRSAFEALPHNHRQRPPLRSLLKRHLVAAGNAAMDRAKPELAAKKLLAAAKLFDPALVFKRSPRDEPLRRLAQRVRSMFSQRGDVSRALPALCIEMGMEPNNANLRREFHRIRSWLSDPSMALRGRVMQSSRLIDAYEKALGVWPSAVLVNELYGLYMQRLVALSEEGQRRALSDSRFTFAAVQWTGYSVAKMYLWIDRPDKALEYLPASAAAKRDNLLRGLLMRAVSSRAEIQSHLQLAAVFGHRDPAVALRLCKRAARTFATDPRAHACIGQMASRVGKTGLAVAAFETAHRMEPKNAAYAKKLAAQYQRQLFEFVEGEQIKAAERSLTRILEFYRLAKQPIKKNLSGPLAKAFFALGLGQYNAGRISDAIQSLKRSLRAKLSPEALVQLATIDFKAGNGQAALDRLKKAQTLKLPPAQWLYWRSRIAHLSAGATQLIDPSRAKKAQNHAVRLWRQWLSLDLPPTVAAEALVRQAESLFDAGQRVEALESVERAIDLAPGRKESYADAIALLTTRGHLPEALDALHRALGRPEVTEYLKAYCSMWVINLARRAKLAADPLAIKYIEGLSGKKWYHRLAAYALGKVSHEVLKKEATSNSKRAELYYYRSETLLADNQLAAARALWRKVIATDMMAFFEYDMALHHLRVGPAPVVTRPIERRPQAPVARQTKQADAK